jgi:type I restriction enzyme S subunit
VRKLDIAQIAQGVSVVHLYGESLRRLKVRFPSKSEQEKISSLLSSIDERIETQSRIINEIQSLISGITQKISNHSSIRVTMLSELLVERNEKNTALFPVHSVSVSEGVVNQIDYLGRSFAAADTSHYNVVHKGDIIYTKSPTGEFPFGIVKRSSIESNVSVSPLYGVYKPISDDVAIYLHYYFCSPLNAQNYLHKLIQKGAKNTINITNQRFLENYLPLPDKNTLSGFVSLIGVISAKLESERSLLESLHRQKRYLLTQMFV